MATMSGLNGGFVMVGHTVVIHGAADVQIALSGHAQATARSLYAVCAFARGGDAGAMLFVSANGLQVGCADAPYSPWI